MLFSPFFKKNLGIVCAILFLLSSSLSAFNFQNLSLEEAKSQAFIQNKLIFVHYHASWCLSCIQMKRTVFSDTQVQKKLEDNFILVEVEVDQSPDKIWIESYGVYVLPTMMFTQKNGLEIKRKQSPLNKSDFLELIYSVLINNPITQLPPTTPGIVHTPITKPLDAPVLLETHPEENSQFVVAPQEKQRVVAPVIVKEEIYSPPGTIYATEIPDELFIIQVGAYFKHSQAQRLVDELLELQFENSEIAIEETNGRTMYKVIIGQLPSIKKARLLLFDIQNSGYEAYIKHM